MVSCTKYVSQTMMIVACNTMLGHISCLYGVALHSARSGAMIPATHSTHTRCRQETLGGKPHTSVLPKTTFAHNRHIRADGLVISSSVRIKQSWKNKDTVTKKHTRACLRWCSMSLGAAQMACCPLCSCTMLSCCSVLITSSLLMAVRSLSSCSVR